MWKIMVHFAGNSEEVCKDMLSSRETKFELSTQLNTFLFSRLPFLQVGQSSVVSSKEKPSGTKVGRCRKREVLLYL